MISRVRPPIVHNNLQTCPCHRTELAYTNCALKQGHTHIYSAFRELGPDRAFQSVAELREDRVVSEVALIEERARDHAKLVTYQAKQRLAGEDYDSLLHG